MQAPPYSDKPDRPGLDCRVDRGYDPAPPDPPGFPEALGPPAVASGSGSGSRQRVGEVGPQKSAPEAGQGKLGPSAGSPGVGRRAGDT